MISREEIKKILKERKLYADIPENLDDKEYFYLDSLSLIWFIEGLSERLNIIIPLEENVKEFNSIDNIYNYLNSFK
jgi:acyl carrier protein